MYSTNRKLILIEYSPCSGPNTAIQSRMPNTRRRYNAILNVSPNACNELTFAMLALIARLLLGSVSPVAAIKAKAWTRVYRVELPERNKRTFRNDGRQEWSLIGKIHRESMTRRWKALLRDCCCRGFMILVGPNARNVVVPSDHTMRLSPFCEGRY